jgi:hypothetical protein
MLNTATLPSNCGMVVEISASGQIISCRRATLADCKKKQTLEEERAELLAHASELSDRLRYVLDELRVLDEGETK